MEICEVTSGEYDTLFTSAACFNKAAFNKLNAYRCDELFCLVFKDKKIRLGLVAGLQGKCLSSPFSAPFGGFATKDSNIQITYIEESVDLLEQFCRERHLSSVNMTLPPLFYDPTFLTKVMHVLYRKQWRLNQVDLNFFYNLTDKQPTHSKLTYSARKNLNVALKQPFTFEKGNTSDHLAAAYEIIRQNRALKGFPMRMTGLQMQETSTVVSIDSFLIRYNGMPVAAAIVYQVTPTIIQVVYWGDLPEFAPFRTMNYLTNKLFTFYAEKGYSLIDVGTAMHGSIPNYGLCEFKESVGSDILPRCAFVKELY